MIVRFPMATTNRLRPTHHQGRVKAEASATVKEAASAREKAEAMGPDEAATSEAVTAIWEAVAPAVGAAASDGLQQDLQGQ